MQFASITCPQCGGVQSISVPEQGTKALFRCDLCQAMVGVPAIKKHACVVCEYGNDECPKRVLGHPAHANIAWHKVTWYSKLIAIFLFLVVYIIGFWLGIEYKSVIDQQARYQDITQNSAKDLARASHGKVLGEATSSEHAIYWLDLTKKNPFVEECSGAPTIKENVPGDISLQEVLTYMFNEKRLSDASLVNPLANTDIQLIDIIENDNQTLVKLGGKINSDDFCTQVQVVSVLHQLLSDWRLPTTIEVSLNDIALFTVPVANGTR